MTNKEKAKRFDQIVRHADTQHRKTYYIENSEFEDGLCEAYANILEIATGYHIISAPREIERVLEEILKPETRP